MLGTRIYFNERKLSTFLFREKRFFAYTKDGITYCPNTGKMTDILIKDTDCILSKKAQKQKVNINEKEKIKLEFQLEALWYKNNWTGTNTQNPNKLAKLLLPIIFPNSEPFIAEKSFIMQESNVANNSKRLIFRADFASKTHVIEIKNVHWTRYDEETAYFPDCKTERGAKQMLYLSELAQNFSCYVIYIIQRSGVKYFSLASDVDPLYYKNAQIAEKAGVKFLAFNCNLNMDFIEIANEVIFI